MTHSLAVHGLFAMMVVLTSVHADNLTRCYGVVHLPAGNHTLSLGSNCSDCTIVGTIGTIINGPITCGDTLRFNGSLALHGNGQSNCLTAIRVEFNGDVQVKDCHGIRASNVLINGEHDGSPVSMVNCSTALDTPVSVQANANVTFTDTDFPVGENWFNIENSYAVFERAELYSEYSGYEFTNSTIIATDTSFAGGHDHFWATNSALNFTNSSVNIVMGNWYPGISVSNCSVDVTCPSSNQLGNAVFFTGATNYGSMGMDIIGSTVRFERCSCHLDHAITVAGPLSMRNGSDVSFSMCSEYDASSRGGPLELMIV